MKRFGLALCLVALVGPALAETTPPGDYSDTGRVVRTTRGSIELFDGHGCRLMLDEKLQAGLAPYVGEFVRVDYTRAEATDGAHLDDSGAPIVKIRKVTSLAKDAAALPVGISVRPVAGRVPIGDPVRVQVTLTNRTDEPVLVDAGSGECHLLQDYRWMLSLGSEGRQSAAHPARERIAPRGELVVTLESAWMAEPGVYDLIFTLPDSNRPFAYQSDLVPITVLPARDAAEEAAALRAWVSRASPTQRIKLAERLLAQGDDRGVDEVLRLFADRKAWGSYTYAPAYRFLWQHGGERGEKAMLAELDRKTGQDPALRVIEVVHLSPRALALLEVLLAERRETSRDISGWCDRPRVCDITAAWLVGYTDYKMKFPEGGSVKERDAAVATVQKALRENPKQFSILK